MPVPPRTPVIVGIAQLNQRCDPAEAKEPVDLMADAAREAARDCGTVAILSAIDSLRVVRGIWPYRNPGSLVADRLGIGEVKTSLSPIGGNTGQEVVLSSAADILAGRRDVVLVCASETMRTRRKEHSAGIETSYAEEAADAAPDEGSREDEAMTTDAENTAGIATPTHFYAMVENALRHRNGATAEQHTRKLADFYAAYSRVAADNPSAWSREARDAEQIAEVGPRNRMVAHPYPKLMTSNIDVDQAVAILLCSEERADELGVPRDKRVYPLAGSYAKDHWFPSERDRLDESPAMRIAGKHALESAGLEATDVDFVDLYSCFPAAVQMAQREIGFDGSKVPTVTGGMTFAGGPLNSFVLHSIARTVELLRENPSAKGFVSGNGGYFTKHSFGVYGAQPPGQPFRYESPQAEVDALPKRAIDESYRGTADVEAYTVVYGRNGRPESGIVAALTPSGSRVFATTSDESLMEKLLDRDACEATATVDGTDLQGVSF